jgi:hypothetical protein
VSTACGLFPVAMRGKVAPMPFPPNLKILAVTAALLSVVVGCQAKIGDKCAIGIDCSQTGGRVCDTSLPGGYCTVPNCEPDICPEEAACIAFVLAPSTASACAATSDSREIRSFCMRSCTSNEDCRAGYVCDDLNLDGNPWGAKRIDRGSRDGRVCTVPYTAAPANSHVPGTADAPMTEYCTAGPYLGAGASSGDNDHYAAVAAGGASWANPAKAGNAGTAGSAGMIGSAGMSGDAATAGAAGSNQSSGGSAGTAGNAGAQGELDGSAGTAGVASGAE